MIQKMKKVNEHLIKVSAGRIPIEEPLELGVEVRIAVDGEVVKTEDTDNQDGTINRTYIIKGMVAYER